MNEEEDGVFEFVLIGDPVAHSLSPVMHNALYQHLAMSRPEFAQWRYSAVRCPDEQSAEEQVSRVREGGYCGMNITMPWKRLALRQADYVDSSADAAGGANVLVREGGVLNAYNTDGLGAVGAIARVTGAGPRGMRVGVCGTGPTSVAIAAAYANAGAGEITLFSRDPKRAESTIERLRLSLQPGATQWMRAAAYTDAPGLVPSLNVLCDATPRGMEPGDEPIVDPALFHEGQIVFDTVYAHGVTALVGGARSQGAFAMDGFEMLVEQAALSVEIWARALGIDLNVPRDVMRAAAESA